MISVFLFTIVSTATAGFRAGVDLAPLTQRNIIAVLDAENADIASRLNLNGSSIRPFIGWESRHGRVELRGDFSWDQTDTWVEADHTYSHFGLLRLRLDGQKRLNENNTISPVVGVGLRLDRGFADLHSDSTTAEEIDNALILTEEIKAALNKYGVIGSFGAEWAILPQLQVGFRADLTILIRNRDSETSGVSRRITVENDAVVTCGWKF